MSRFFAITDDCILLFDNILYFKVAGNEIRAGLVIPSESQKASRELLVSKYEHHDRAVVALREINTRLAQFEELRRVETQRTNRSEEKQST